MIKLAWNSGWENPSQTGGPADNARPHPEKLTLKFIEQNAMKRVPHTPYSSDPAPSDLYLLVHVKQCLSGCPFADADSLLQAESDILERLEKVTLEGLFRNWMEKLRQ
jgi:hypothetical protein